jgi:xylulokinase
MYLGLDFGTGGARACVLDEFNNIVHEDRTAYGHAAIQTAENWRDALYTLLSRIPKKITLQLKGIAVDGTSSSVLLCDAQLQPISPILLYNDSRAQNQLEFLINVAPPGHIVCSSTSGLAKFLWLTQNVALNNARYFMHQADWISSLLTGIGGVSDYHNALKTGYDVENLCWPDWVKQLPYANLLPKVITPGQKIATISPLLANQFKFNSSCYVHAGTTDSIAAFIASEVDQAGQAVTSLGTTLVLKLLSTTRVESTEYGVYSHRYGNMWLAGGASNSGSGILSLYFSNSQLQELSKQIDTSSTSPLDYYPLTHPGERFPYNDPKLPPRISPRPDNDVAFLHGLLQGVGRIELLGYKRLAELGATSLKSITTSGGGAANAPWIQLRSYLINVPVTKAIHTEAAIGSAKLAKLGIAVTKTTDKKTK